jgi:DNA-binding GntR family transcriptional regulator
MPGSRLSEQEIATRYGVSRQPVREALIALAKSNLVEIRPHRGTVVVRISLKKMHEARFVREAVEVAVVRRAAGQFDPWMHDRIAANLQQQKTVVASGDHNQFRTLDGQFHILIAKGAGCEMAWTAISDMKAHMDRACNLTLESADARAALLSQHIQIMDAIDRHDPDTAEQVMRAHLQSILKDLPAVERAHPELFE